MSTTRLRMCIFRRVVLLKDRIIKNDQNKNDYYFMETFPLCIVLIWKRFYNVY